jgi:hypothetical protein
MVDSNGDDVLVWLEKDVYLFSRRAESREHIASLEGVTSMKIRTKMGSLFLWPRMMKYYYFDERRIAGSRGESLWYNTEKSVDEGRETQETTITDSHGIGCVS